MTLRNFHTDPRRSMLQARPDTLGRYEHLWLLYDNNRMYAEWARLASIYGVETPEAMKPLRTVVNRSVEFFVAKTAPSDGMNVEASPAVQNAIAQVTRWSNYEANKPTYLRYMSLLGDLFIKVNVDAGKVWHSMIDPAHVTAFEADSRGYLQWVLINVDQGAGEWWTEYWTKDGWQVWQHMKGPVSDPEELGTLGEASQSGLTSSLGIDFVPIVHAKFRDVGDDRGHGCVDHALAKIEEANRKATRLAQLLYMYNKNTWAAEQAATVDPKNVPVAKPLSKADLDGKTLSDNAILGLPAGYTLKSLVPNINYDAALAALNADMDELREDLPELRYYSLRESGQISGKAMSMLMGASMDRANEARVNFLQAMQRVNEISLTMAAFANLPGFRGIGQYARGDFNHTILEDQSFSEDISDKAITLQALTTAGMTLEEAMRVAGIQQEQTGAFRRLEIAATVDLTEGAPVTPTGEET